MKSKDIIVGVIAVAVIVGGLGLILKAPSSKKVAAKAAVTKKVIAPVVKEAVKATTPKKTISKDMGGLTIQIVDAKGNPASVPVKSFRSVDIKSGILTNSFSSNRMQELIPGNYDIELGTAPQKLYKGIGVSVGKETIENLGCLTGILNVKVLDAKGKAAQTQLKIYQAKTGILVTSTSANRPLELLAGAYDIEIGVVPKVMESAVVIEPGKEKVLDLGVMTGVLIIKATDENKIEKKDARHSVKITKADNKEVVINGRVNRPIEIRPGTYVVETNTVPPQINNNVIISAGGEAVLEVVIQTPPQAKAQPAPSPAPVAPIPAKGK